MVVPWRNWLSPLRPVDRPLEGEAVAAASSRPTAITVVAYVGNDLCVVPGRWVWQGAACAYVSAILLSIPDKRCGGSFREFLTKDLKSDAFTAISAIKASLFCGQSTILHCGFNSA